MLASSILITTSIEKEMAQHERFGVQLPSYDQADEEDTPFGSIHRAHDAKRMDLSSSTEDVIGWLWATNIAKQQSKAVPTTTKSKSFSCLRNWEQGAGRWACDKEPAVQI